MMTPREIREVVHLIYGPNGLARAAERLGKTRRTIERYMDGTRNPPADLRRELDAIIEEQMQALKACHSEHA